MINGIRTWKSAHSVIDILFDTKGINPYSKEAIEFSNCIYLRYFPRENKGFEDNEKLAPASKIFESMKQYIVNKK